VSASLTAVFTIVGVDDFVDIVVEGVPNQFTVLLEMIVLKLNIFSESSLLKVIDVANMIE